MGIKTRFNPMGGPSGDSKIPDAWSYTTETNGIRTLWFYNSAIGGDIVEVPNKRTQLQDYYWYGVNSYGVLPFYNQVTLTDVDLQRVPFKNNSMVNAFRNCYNLIEVKGLNRNVTDMYGTFHNCYNLSQNVQIPDSVTNMVDTFRNCRNLNQNIKIPDSVTNMSFTFYGCGSLNQNIKLPNSVTTMGYTFYGCSSLNQNIQIPNSVTNMCNTFSGCTKLNQNIQIPDSVTNMYGTFQNCSNLNQNIQIPNNITNIWHIFYSCYNLNQNIQIPNSVTNMSESFSNCYNLGQNIQTSNSVTNMYGTFMNCWDMGSSSKTVTLLSAEVSFINRCFENTSRRNMSNQLTVVFPMRYINNVNTVTSNSLASTGYAVGTGLGITSANTTQNRNLLLWDIIPYQGYNTYTGNGTHWILTKWNGRNGKLSSEVKIPTTIKTYDSFPTSYTPATFYASNIITKLDCSNIVTNGTSAVNMFRLMSNVTEISNIKLNEGTTSCVAMFYTDSLITEISNFYMPNSVTNVQSIYGLCKNLSNMYINSFGVTQLSYACDYCNTRPINVYIKSPDATAFTNMFRGYNASFRKNIYIYFKYANGVDTKTFNLFKPVLYTGSTGNSGGVSPMYNSASNFYVYNLGVCPI